MSDPLTGPDPKYSTWYAKNWACSTSQRLLIPGRNVSVDEQLIQFKGRSRHSMKMAVKKAKKGFKIYSLCWTSYIITFLWTSKATKISNLERTKGCQSRLLWWYTFARNYLVTKRLNMWFGRTTSLPILSCIKLLILEWVVTNVSSNIGRKVDWFLRCGMGCNYICRLHMKLASGPADSCMGWGLISAWLTARDSQLLYLAS